MTTKHFTLMVRRKKAHKIGALLLMTSLFFALMARDVLCASVATNKIIAVVHSYHKDFKWVHAVNRGITDFHNGKELFGIKPDSHFAEYKLIYFYMNAIDRSFDEKYLTNKGRDIITKIKQIRPSVVMVSDDEALEYVAAPLKEDESLKFVFLGVNNDPREYGVVSSYQFPEYNITGLISDHPFVYSIKMISRIFPNRPNIYVFLTTQIVVKAFIKIW